MPRTPLGDGNAAPLLLPVSIAAIKGVCKSRGREDALDSAQDARIGQAMLRYIEASRDVQTLLQQTLTQVAGYSLMLMTSPRPASQAADAISIARAAAARAWDQARALRMALRRAPCGRSDGAKEERMADYSIWVLEYAAVEKFPFSVMMYGPQHQGTRKLGRGLFRNAFFGTYGKSGKR